MHCQVADSGIFTVSSLYSFSTSLLGPLLSLSKFIWNHILPPKALFFGWLAWKYKIKTSEFLHNLVILGNNLSTSCIFCNAAPEFAQHILLHCSFSWAIWSSVLQDWGLQWCIPLSVAGLFNWWLEANFKSFLRQFWRYKFETLFS
ncbi:hypothetical protein ACSBR1_033060 [Camellia fascicularis]